MKRWNRWVAWWTAPDDPRGLAAFRILVCLTVFWDMMVLAEALNPVYVPESEGGLASNTAGNWLIELLGGASQANAWSVWCLAVAGAVLGGLGLFGRVGPLLMMLGLPALFSLHTSAGGGHDRLMTNAVWLLVLGSGSQVWSLDAWRREGPPPVVWRWVRWLGIYQLTVMYVATGIQKQGDTWLSRGNFDALWYSLQLPFWQRFDMGWLVPFAPLLRVSTAITLAWEWLFFILPITMVLRMRGKKVPDLRWAFLLPGIAMHGTLWVLMDVGAFSPISLSFYPLFYAYMAGEKSSPAERV